MKNLIKLLPIVFILLFQSCQKNVDEDPKPLQSSKPGFNVLLDLMSDNIYDTPGKNDSYDVLLTVLSSVDDLPYLRKNIKCVNLYDSTDQQPNRFLVGSTNIINEGYVMLNPDQSVCYMFRLESVSFGKHFYSVEIVFIDGTTSNFEGFDSSVDIDGYQPHNEL